MNERNDVKKGKGEINRAACPACDCLVEVSHEMEGRKGQCPSCDHKFIIDSSTFSADTKRKQRKRKRESKDEVGISDQSDEETSGESKRRLLRLPIILAPILLILLGFIWYPETHDNKDGKENLEPKAVKSTEPRKVEPTPVAAAIPEVGPIEPSASVELDQTISPSTIPALKEPSLLKEPALLEEPTLSKEPTLLEEPAPLKELAPLKENKIKILSVAKNSGYFMVHSPSASDEELAEIISQSSSIVWLNLNQSSISDASLPLIAEMPSLTRLQLKACPISDIGLVHLKNHPTLQTLFLNQCGEITDSSLEVFESLPALKSLYIEGTQVTAEAVALLREKLPNLKIRH